MYVATVCFSMPMRLPISAFGSPYCASSFISTYWSKVTTLLQPSCEDDASTGKHIIRESGSFYSGDCGNFLTGGDSGNRLCSRRARNPRVAGLDR